MCEISNTTLKPQDILLDYRTHEWYAFKGKKIVLASLLLKLQLVAWAIYHVAWATNTLCEQHKVMSAIPYSD